MPLPEQEITERIRMGQKFCRKFASNDREASLKFRDASNMPVYLPEDEDEDDEGGDVPQDAPVGQVNNLATNIITKVAGIGIGDPDFFVQCGNPENAQIVRTFLREKWRLNDWVRLTNTIAMKAYVGGMGVAAYRWDDLKRSAWEHVQSWQLSLDPHLNDWNDVEFAAREVKMSLRKAVARYGAAQIPVASGGDSNPDRATVKVWVYWDKTTEAHMLDGKTLLNKERTDNLYGRVPLLFYLGSPDPGPSVWPLGDYALGSGLQAELSDLNAIISNTAKNGGPLNLFSQDDLGKAGTEALESGDGWIPVKDIVTPPIHRIPGESLSETLIIAKRDTSLGLDALQGVNQFMRGVADQKINFATEAALIGQQSGARGIQARLDFERFLNRMAETTIMLERAFGGPRPGHSTDEEIALWEALSDVQEVRVIESSTAYKDPAYEQQQALQALQVVSGIIPLFLQLGYPEIPDLKTYVDDYLRASGKQDVIKRWIPAPMQSAMPPAPAPPGA